MERLPRSAFHPGIVSCCHIDPVIDSVKSRAPAACHCSTPGALLFNYGLSCTFSLLPLKSLIDFYTRLLPCSLFSILKANPSRLSRSEWKKNEICQRFSPGFQVCCRHVSPPLNNHPDMDFFIFNLMILDCFCENKNIKIPILPLLIWGS